MSRFALTGVRFSGKTTLGRYMQEYHGWDFLDYTGRLKQHLVNALNGVYGTNHVDLSDINRDKKRYRRLLQELGTYMGYDQGYDVAYLLNVWNVSGALEPVVFDNVRFMPQFELLKRNGFVLVGLQVSKSVMLERARNAGVDEAEFEKQGEHAAEAGVKPEIMLDGDAPIEENADILYRLAGAREGMRVRKPAVQSHSSRRTSVQPLTAASVN